MASSRSSASSASGRSARRNAQARLAAAEAEAHEGVVPEHEIIHTSRRRDGLAAVVRTGSLSTMPRSRWRASSPATATPRFSTVSGYDLLPARWWRCSAPTARASRRCARSARDSSTRPSAPSPSPGHDITHASSYQRARDGLLLVPEARGIFPGPDRRGEPHRAPPRSRSCGSRRSTGSRSSRSAGSRSPACCRVASSRC